MDHLQVLGEFLSRDMAHTNHTSTATACQMYSIKGIHGYQHSGSVHNNVQDELVIDLFIPSPSLAPLKSL